MSDPVLRIYLTAKGVQKIDAPVSTDEDRSRALAFLADKASAAIQRLDASMRGSRQ
jgi:hypothetical protein